MVQTCWLNCIIQHLQRDYKKNQTANFKTKTKTKITRIVLRQSDSLILRFNIHANYGGAESAGVENAGVEKAGAMTYGKPSEQKTLKTPG